MRIDELFQIAKVDKAGPLPWRMKPIPDNCSGVSGVYVIARAGNEPVPTVDWDAPLRQRWIENEEIIYIGRATNLRRRILQFYRHKLGDKSPHKGGEDLLRLTCPLQVYWGVTSNFKAVEHQMIEAFKSRAHEMMPFANRVRGTKPVVS